MSTPLEVLDHLESGLLKAHHDCDAAGLDRRQFIFSSLVAAAAGTFGASAAEAQRTGHRISAPSLSDQAVRSLLAQQAVEPLGNSEAPALQFQPYPGGTGAAIERLARERGWAAFERAVFSVEPFQGSLPTRDDDIAFLPAHRLSALIRERRITSARLTDIYLARLKQLNPTLLCAVTIMENAARGEAARADAELAAGHYRGPLHGLPYGLKDLFSTKGVPTTWGAADFQDRIIDEDAEIVVRLRNAGAVLIAKLSTGLFAQNDQWFRGRTNNPWNLSLGSSGSSAGPGSATAAACVAFSIGTETQGSIVSPSIRCGVSALRPTFGRVSRTGGMVLAWTMDRVGPMCRTVEDCAMVFNAIHGVDESDPSTVTTPFHFDRNIDVSALRVGIDPAAPKEFADGLRAIGVRPREISARPTVPGSGSGLNVEYAAAFDAYVQRKAKEIGLDLNNLPAPAAVGTPANTPSTPANPMAPADWNPRFVNGRRTLAFEFLQQQRRRYKLIAQWGEFMRDLDMFVGAPTVDIGPNAQTGHPCVVVPYKFDVPAQGGAQRSAAPPAGATPGATAGAASGAGAVALNPQPICGVIVGALYQDDKILGLAHRFQSSADFHLRRPAL